MNSDIRYHIASLSGVFLALGIGILIGTAFVGTRVVQRQTSLIRRLEENVGDLRRETATRDNTEKALSALVPGMITGKLAGRSVLVVQSGSYRNAADDAAETLKGAGAIVAQISLPTEAWRREISRDTSALTDPSAASEAASKLAREIAPLLLRGDTSGGASPLQTYRDRGLLVDDGPSITGPFRLVVLAGGASIASASSGAAEETALQTFIQQRDLPMIEVWTGRGATVAAVEPLVTGVSFLRLYQEGGIATVDAVDHAAGQIALTFALLGDKGDFGLRPTADRVLPASVEKLRFMPPPPPVKPSSSAIASPAPSPSPAMVKRPASP